MSSASQVLGFFVASAPLGAVAPSLPGSAAPPRLPWLAVPCLSFLSSSPGAAPHISADAPPDPAAAIFLEPIRSGQKFQLLLGSPPCRRVLVNGQSPARIVLLTVKDQVQVDPDHVLHVSIFCQPYVGPPSPDLIGKCCPLCLSPFSPSSVVFVCPCGCALHSEGADIPVSKRLECARLSRSCSSCQQPLSWSAGHVFYPET